MKSILENELYEYNLDLDSKLSEIDDVYDFINFIMKCEEYYNFELYDDEAGFLEIKDLTFLQIEDFFIFLRDGFATEFIHNLVVSNLQDLKRIRKYYEDYIVKNRDNKLNNLLNES